MVEIFDLALRTVIDSFQNYIMNFSIKKNFETHFIMSITLFWVVETKHKSFIQKALEFFFYYIYVFSRVPKKIVISFEFEFLKFKFFEFEFFEFKFFEFEFFEFEFLFSCV